MIHTVVNVPAEEACCSSCRSGAMLVASGRKRNAWLGILRTSPVVVHGNAEFGRHAGQKEELGIWCRYDGSIGDDILHNFRGLADLKDLSREGPIRVSI